MTARIPLVSNACAFHVRKSSLSLIEFIIVIRTENTNEPAFTAPPSRPPSRVEMDVSQYTPFATTSGKGVLLRYLSESADFHAASSSEHGTGNKYYE